MLSAVVFVIGVKLIDLAGMREIYRLRRDEFSVAALTAVVVVGLGVEQGIILAIVISLLLHVKRHYGPHSRVVSRDAHGHVNLAPLSDGAATEPGLIVYRFSVGLFYANAERLSEDVRGLVDVADPPRWLVLLADGIDDVDFTGGKTLMETAEQLAQRGIVFGIAVVSDEVRRELDAFGVTERIGEDRYFATLDDAFEAFHAAAYG